jgi:hypothetical protein
VIGQLGVGPVGPVEPLTGRTIDHPAADLLGHVGRDRRGVAPGLARLEAVEATTEVGVEPPLDGAGHDPQVGGDVLVLPTPVGQADDLEPVEELTVGGLAEGPFEALGLGVGQLDADHGRGRMEEIGSPPPSTNRTASAGL